MKESKLIEELQSQMKYFGDVEVKIAFNTGNATNSIAYSKNVDSVSVEKEQIILWEQ
jgi:hypothetical protein